MGTDRCVPEGFARGIVFFVPPARAQIGVPSRRAGSFARVRQNPGWNGRTSMGIYCTRLCAVQGYVGCDVRPHPQQSQQGNNLDGHIGPLD